MRGILGPILLSLTVLFSACSGGMKSQDQSSQDNNSLNNPPAGSIPTAPSGLVLTAKSSTQIDVQWTDNSSDELAFRVERAFSNAGPFSPGTGPGAFSFYKNVGSNITTYSDTGLSPNTTYYYRVSAGNTAGYSAPSVVVSIKTPNAAAAPPAPPSNLTATATAASLVTLSWQDNSNNEDNFVLERSSDGGTTFRLVVYAGSNITSYQDINLIEMTTYIYRVRAVNSAGASTNSANTSVTTLSAGDKTTFNYVYTNIIQPNCVSCHGNAGGVTLSSYNNVRNYVTAGNAAGSTLYTAITQRNMPPGSPLSTDQITSLRNWINNGAQNN